MFFKQKYFLIIAPTAAAQKAEELPLTYLNKGNAIKSSNIISYGWPLEGQYYIIHLKDNGKYDGEVSSTVVVTFHDENHRANAADNWKTWLAQQKENDDIRAIGLGK